MDITKLSITELKSLAYDEMAKIQQAQNNLNIINAEISKKMVEPATEPTEVIEAEEVKG